jgi:glycosyltransferase involved in cell wall biosynthesis
MAVTSQRADDATKTSSREAGVLQVAAFPRMHLNPYGQLFYAALSRTGIELADDPRFDAKWMWRNRRRIAFLHFHWDGGYYESQRERFHEIRSWIGLARYAMRLWLARALGYRIAWTVHEVVPHEPRSVRRDIMAGRILARSSHALFAHDQPTAFRAKKVLRTGGREISVVPHGQYGDVYPPGRPRDDVRAEWDLDRGSFVFLAFGNLRRYKRIEQLLDAFALVEAPHAALVIAGDFVWRIRQPEFERRLVARLEDAAGADHRIRFRIGRVPDDQVGELHSACDAAVLARSDGWTSGSLILALCNGLPVVAARTPAYVDLLGNGAAGWFFEPDDVNSLAQTLSRVAAARAPAVQKRAAASRRAATLHWHDAATVTAAAKRATLPAGRSHRG